MKPYYEADGITIYYGDCREVLPSLVADVLITDPPYGINYGSGWGNALPGITGDSDTSLRDFVLGYWKDRPAAVFGSWKRPKPPNIRGVLIWDKGTSGMGDLSLPWRPNWEEIYILGNGWHGHRGSSILTAETVVTWNSRLGQRVHPHQKPVGLLRQLIEKAPPGCVLDPFMGSGSTLRAAKDLGRRAIGIEIEQRYCEIAAERLAQGVLATVPASIDELVDDITEEPYLW